MRFASGLKVILLDDHLATVCTLAAGEALIGNIDGVEIVANIVIREISFLHGRDKLLKKLTQSSTLNEIPVLSGTYSSAYFY